MKIEMIANKGFANSKIEGPRNDGSVLAGEPFKTDWLHARELRAGGLAKPKNPKDLDQEPSDEISAHSGISAPDHAKINERRAGLRAGKDDAGKTNDGKGAGGGSSSGAAA